MPTRCIVVGARVSGAFGNFVENPNPRIKRRLRNCLYGHVVPAFGRKEYNVLWDNSVEQRVSSNRLCIEDVESGVPVHDLPEQVQVTLADDGIVDEDSSTSGSNGDVEVNIEKGRNTAEGLQLDDKSDASYSSVLSDNEDSVFELTTPTDDDDDNDMEYDADEDEEFLAEAKSHTQTENVKTAWEKVRSFIGDTTKETADKVCECDLTHYCHKIVCCFSHKFCPQ